MNNSSNININNNPTQTMNMNKNGVFHSDTFKIPLKQFQSLQSPPEGSKENSLFDNFECKMENMSQIDQSNTTKSGKPRKRRGRKPKRRCSILSESAMENQKLMASTHHQHPYFIQYPNMMFQSNGITPNSFVNGVCVNGVPNSTQKQMNPFNLHVNTKSGDPMNSKKNIQNQVCEKNKTIQNMNSSNIYSNNINPFIFQGNNGQKTPMMYFNPFCSIPLNDGNKKRKRGRPKKNTSPQFHPYFPQYFPFAPFVDSSVISNVKPLQKKKENSKPVKKGTNTKEKRTTSNSKSKNSKSNTKKSTQMLNGKKEKVEKKTIVKKNVNHNDNDMSDGEDEEFVLELKFLPSECEDEKKFINDIVSKAENIINNENFDRNKFENGITIQDNDNSVGLVIKEKNDTSMKTRDYCMKSEKKSYSNSQEGSFANAPKIELNSNEIDQTEKKQNRNLFINTSTTAKKGLNFRNSPMVSKMSPLIFSPGSFLLFPNDEMDNLNNNVTNNNNEKKKNNLSISPFENNYQCTFPSLLTNEENNNTGKNVVELDLNQETTDYSFLNDANNTMDYILENDSSCFSTNTETEDITSENSYHMLSDSSGENNHFDVSQIDSQIDNFVDLNGTQLVDESANNKNNMFGRDTNSYVNFGKSSHDYSHFNNTNNKFNSNTENKKNNLQLDMSMLSVLTDKRNELNLGNSLNVN